jgi:hypothetical protein
MLELGCRVKGLLNLAKIHDTDHWVGHGLKFWGQRDHHSELLLALEAFHAAFDQADMAALPAGWVEMRHLLDEWRNMLSDPLGPVEDPPESVRMTAVRVRHAIATGRLKFASWAVRSSRHDGALHFADLWDPIWYQLWPALEKRVGMPRVTPATGTVAQQLAAMFEANRADPNHMVRPQEIARISGQEAPRLAVVVNDELERVGSSIRVTSRDGALVRTFKASAFKPRRKNRRKSPPKK